MNGTVRKGQKIRFMQAGTTHEVIELGQFVPAASRVRRAAGRPGRLPDLQHQVARRRPHRRHGHACRGEPAAEPLPGYQEPQADGLLRPLSVRRPGFRGAARRARQARASTTPASSSSPRRATRSASAFAAASWACCTWRSSSSGWSGKPTSTWCRRRRTSRTKSLTNSGETLRIHKPQKVPDAGRDRGVSPADRAGEFRAADRVDRPDHAALRRPPRRVRADRVSLADAGDADVTTCRWPR